MSCLNGRGPISFCPRVWITTPSCWRLEGGSQCAFVRAAAEVGGVSVLPWENNTHTRYTHTWCCETCCILNLQATEWGPAQGDVALESLRDVSSQFDLKEWMTVDYQWRERRAFYFWKQYELQPRGRCVGGMVWDLDQCRVDASRRASSWKALFCRFRVSQSLELRQRSDPQFLMSLLSVS